MTYAVATHPTLSAAARAVRDAEDGTAAAPSGAFVAEADAAEITLGLNGTAFQGPDLDAARLAVALQLNLQVATSGERPVKSETRGERRVDYADVGAVSARAKAIADRLLATLTSVSADTPDDWVVVGNTR